MGDYRADLSRWIDEAISSLHLTIDTFRQLLDEEVLLVYWQAEDRFVSKQRQWWWWEHFRCRHCGALLRGYTYLHLTQLAATPQERVWLVLTDVYKGDPLVYEGTVEACQHVIGDCPAFEYNIVSHDFKWLLCENHHEVLYAVGFLAMRRLRRYAAQHPEQPGAAWPPVGGALQIDPDDELSCTLSCRRFETASSVLRQSHSPPCHRGACSAPLLPNPRHQPLAPARPI